MKRTVILLSLIFALAIALSVSIPTLAANTTTVSGTLAGKVEITTPPVTSYTFTGGLPGTDPAAVTVTVKSNQGWSLTAQASRMTEGAKTLTYALDGSGNGGAWLNLSSTQILNSGTSKTGKDGVTTTVGFRQLILDGVDEPSTGTGYTTTVQFTAN
jgi:hypothetical protein